MIVSDHPPARLFPGRFQWFTLAEDHLTLSLHRGNRGCTFQPSVDDVGSRFVLWKFVFALRSEVAPIVGTFGFYVRVGGNRFWGNGVGLAGVFLLLCCSFPTNRPKKMHDFIDLLRSRSSVFPSPRFAPRIAERFWLLSNFSLLHLDD